MTPAHELDNCLTWLVDPQHLIIAASDEAYPEPLRAIADYRGALFVKGDIEVLKSQQLAGVGSRAHSWYGERWRRIFCETFVGAG